ncbi:cation:proton antiporter, partial [Candidatus Dojkabacteria bacterium]|nr:cation:proton antiporter [Candidatus Dojkabacteria bacterium]
AGVVSAFIAVKLRLPTVLGYLIGGILLSLVLARGTLHSELINSIAQLGAAFLLFTIGVEFSWDNLQKVRKIVVIGAILQAVISTLAAMLLLPLFGFDQYQSFLIGGLVSLSSTAFVVKMLEMRSELYTRAGNIMVGWLIMQDIMIVVWFLLFQSFAPGAAATDNIILVVIKSVVAIGGVFLVGKYLLPRVMAEIARLGSDELLLVTVVGVIAGFAAGANLLGISFTIGAFLAGLSLSESVLYHEIFTEVKPLRNLLMMIFFVSIGSLFDVNEVLDNLPVFLFILVVLLAVKAATIVIINLWFEVHIKNALRVGLGIIQIGEFAFLGAQLALENGWIDSRIHSLLIATTVISMALTPFIYANADSVYKFLEGRLKGISPNLYRHLFLSAPEDIQPNRQLQGHVIVCGHGRVGKYVVEALVKSQIPFLVIEMDTELAEELSRKGIPVLFGDSSNADILESAKVSMAKAVVVTLPTHEEVKAVVTATKKLNPGIKVVVRSHYAEANQP